MPVQQHVLNWLYSILTSEYHDVNRTYNDVAHTLTRYPSLAPRTDVHTFPNGASALLLHLAGTIPVSFRGSTYRFPMSIWVPHAYPREPPLVYVTPTGNMMIRPGQHVDPQGQVYHPYLVGWAEFWDKSALHDFLAILSDVFAKEPPVISRQQARPAQSPPPQQTPPPVPPLPPQVAARPTSHDQPRPPAPPPKTTPQDAQGSSTPSTSVNAGLPVPPVPSSTSPVARHASRYDSAPPLPPEAQALTQNPGGPPIQSPGQSGYQSKPSQQHPYDRVTTPMPPRAASGQIQSPPQPQPQPPHLHQAPLPHNNVHGQCHPSGHQNEPPPPWNEPARQRQPQPAAPPPPDLLDEPLTLNVPAQSSVAPPPIPPNPEKDALLGQLAQTLASMRQRSRQQNESSMAGLQAQRNAMLSIIPSLQSEMGQLTQLSNVLTSNTTILHEALHKADGAIEGSKSHPAPDTDELLVAPTVVSNQLYSLVAEERALGDAIFMLGRAVERGRISPAVFAKMTRSLAREWYLKKALVRKIGLGMGLTS